MAPKVSEEEGSYALHFFRWFLESFKSCFLFLVTLPGLVTLFCAVANLKTPAMIVYGMATKVLDTEIFPRHNIADLISVIMFIVLFSLENLYGERK